jgi:hypothetical protein
VKVEARPCALVEQVLQLPMDEPGAIPPTMASGESCVPTHRRAPREAGSLRREIDPQLLPLLTAWAQGLAWAQRRLRP